MFEGFLDFVYMYETGKIVTRLLSGAVLCPHELEIWSEMHVKMTEFQAPVIVPSLPTSGMMNVFL